MRSQSSVVNSGLMITGLLFTLPVLVITMPLVFYMLVIDSGNTTTTSAVQSVPRQSTLSREAAVLATLAAVPPRTAAPPNISSGEAVVVAQALGYSDAMIRAGQTNFLGVCAACHGTDARGISGLGKTLLGSEFVRTMDDQELLTFVINGRAIWDPLNTTGVAMPARGGNPGLTDQDILNIIAYMRVIDGNVPAAVAAAPGSTGQATPAPTYDPNLPSPGSLFAPIDTSGLTPGSGVVAVVETGRKGEDLYNALCEVDDASRAMCEYLVQVAAESADSTRLTVLLTNGSSPFDMTIPPGVFIPQRGGLLLLSDAEIQNLIRYLFNLAGVSAEAGTPAAAPASTGRSGEAIYTALCEVDDNNRAACAYLLQLISEGADDRRLTDLLTNGSSPFDTSIPAGIFIPQRGGLLLLSDTEIQNLIAYLHTLAEGPSTSAPDAEAITETARQNRAQPMGYAPLSYTSELMGSVITPPRELADFTLPATTGEAFTLSEQGGKILLVYFGYLTCPDVCPATLAELRRAYQEVGQPADKVRVVFITLDPARDQLAIMARYVQAFNENFIGLRPESAAQLEALKANFGVTSERRDVVDSEVGYLIDHSASVFMVGPDGRIVAQYPFGVTYHEFTNDLQVVLNYLQTPGEIVAASNTAPVSDGGREYRIVIPKGTGAQIEMGQDPGIIPLKIELTLGQKDILVLENHDISDYLVGGIWVAPYETVRKQFYEPQTFIGLCTVTVGRDLVEIIVSEPVVE